MQLGWLLDPDRRTFYVYRPGVRVKRLVDPRQQVADPPLAGFMLDFSQVR